MPQALKRCESSVDEDVATLRMTPKKLLDGPPSVTSVFLNGGVRRIDFSWDAAGSVIPNRCLSAYAIVCPGSWFTWRQGDLPPPRCSGNVRKRPRGGDG